MTDAVVSKLSDLCKPYLNAETLLSTGKTEAQVQDYIQSVFKSRVFLMSLIERVEITENRQIILFFRFREEQHLQ